MKVLYSLFIAFYGGAVKVVSLFNKKALMRTKGIKQTFSILKQFSSENTIWIHCSSLGEFEQGRSIIEKLKSLKPDHKIALSFFSPSGYEVRKDYEFADLVFYLPYDTKKNARRLIYFLKPKLVFFVKYEFWHHIINEINKNEIPLYLVSGIFRDDQIFFKKQGKFFRKILNKFTHLYVQNELSAKLLRGINITNVSVTGDTRFDRVHQIATNKKRFKIIESFTGDDFVFIAGSTWKKDEEIIFNYINKLESLKIKIILAPHEIGENNILRILNMTDKKIIRFSEMNEQTAEEAEILVIDNIGMLSSLYAYGSIAYIGGGFGAGIHNTLEAAVYGIPIIFGPNYKKFDEAKEMINRKGAFSIAAEDQFFSILNKFISDSDSRLKAGSLNCCFVEENIGSTDKVLSSINL